MVSKIHLQISFPHMPQNWPEDNFDGRDLRFYQRSAPPPDFVAICSTSRFRFLKEAGRKEIMVLRLARSWLPFLSNFLVAPAIYIIPPADHNARIKRPRYEDIRSVNKSWPIAWNCHSATPWEYNLQLWLLQTCELPSYQIIGNWKRW